MCIYIKTIFGFLSNSKKEYVNNMIKLCLDTDEMNHKIELVNSINDVLPYEFKIKIPSLITNNYIDQKLYSLDEKLPRVFFDA
jgi:hypothetical protein